MPDALVDIGAMSALLDERYAEVVEEELQDNVDIRGMIYEVIPADRRTMRASSMGEMAQVQEFPGQLIYDRPYEGYNVQGVPREFAVGLRITQRMLEDDLTDIFSGDLWRPMVRASVTTVNKHASRLFNFADADDTYFYTRSEAVALASNSHTTRVAGVSTATGFDNLVTTALSPTNYRAARLQMRQFRTDRGELTDIIGDELWVPPDLEPRAMEILESDKSPDTGNNAMNPERRTATIKVNIHWNDTNNWALMNGKLRKANCKYLERVPIDYFKIKEFDTFQAKWAVRWRGGTQVRNWRFALWAIVG